LPLPKYTPYLNGEGGVKIGLSPISEFEWLDIDDKFEEEIDLKKNLLKDNREEVLQINNQVEAEQAEVLDTVLKHLQSFHPEKYKINNDSVFIDSSKDFYTFDQFDNPIELASLLIQEDLILMSSKNSKFHLTAASLSAPSHWSLVEKFSKSLMDLHEGVPGYKESIGQRVDEIFDKLPSERILERFNWSIYDNPKLFQPVGSKPNVKFTETEASKLFMRVERQTIRKLPLSNSVLFAIRVYVDPILSLLEDKRLLENLQLALENLSGPMKKYKSIDQFEMNLITWIKENLK
tara:strand:+ start:239 stop:1114 length:876 start_codon:yes stop_codon:yes gene_type:complete